MATKIDAKSMTNQGCVFGICLKRFWEPKVSQNGANGSQKGAKSEPTDDQNA